MGKHTPGPWKNDYKNLANVIATNGAVIAKVKNLTGLLQVQDDATLIAAAPDLLAALVRLSNSYAFIKPPGSPKSDSEKQAEAAIAKATGAP